ncbi:hypothetical protein M409DRAFT_68574 [Zasmidium cellare ATCC 36951]|uniref:RING-type domain-containing protein n=1 Tax=Zasmidium cellare ATCC 36951 TaxID=1080233 RepID=A0A6A6C7X4_ZASCE|nr:uncharacterized protein M409DRAFT_68574 [Zasmidium cellare ATCC 36951]KAF2163287.1 hypothetical protein M409DRAFT_68574 [Zasmidium cellare ATCC 36951]
MGTLTVGQPRLPNYCEHKLPTSCRLSSIGECCACYDNRAHAASYSTYVDGVGFVPRGTRWQRYCWFCKEFWENRVEASGLRPAQTRIPEVPDQGGFLERWYEFHQGYRIVQREDGSEERVAVLGEDLRDVAPGCLPRTLDELRAGRERSEIEERERQQRLQAQSVQEPEADSGPTLEDALDSMLQAAADEETVPSTNRPPPPAQVAQNIHAQAMVPAISRNREYQARRIAALRRELHRMRNGIERVISGLRDLGENVPDHTEASNRLSELGSTLDTIAGVPSSEDAQRAINSVNELTNNVATTQSDRTLASIQTRVDNARQHVNEARRNRDQAATELDVAEQDLRNSQSRLRQLQNEQRTTENYMRLFGSREEMAAQGESYESPIGGMFTRAMERFRAAEETRREEQILRQVLAHEERAENGSDAAVRLAELNTQDRDVWGVPRPRPNADLQQTDITSYMAPLQHDPLQPTSTASSEGNQASRNFPQSMLNRFRPSLHLYEPRHPLAGLTAGSTAEGDTARMPEDSATPYVAGPPGRQLDEDPTSNNDRGLDAMFVLTALAENSTLLRTVPNGPDETTVRRILHDAAENNLSQADCDIIETLTSDENVIWESGLPAERNTRRRQRGEQVTFTPDALDMATSGQVIVHDVEMMAESFQMSALVRRSSGLTGPEQLAVLFRLQRGRRNSDDRAVLSRMLQHDSVLARAREIVEQHQNEPSSATTTRRAALEDSRRSAARQGDHSRAELDAQRRATHQAALAAGRAAMLTGPAALLERLANRDEETRAAYERLQENGFTPPQEPTASTTAETMTTRHLRSGPFYRPLSLDDFTASPSASDSEDSEHEGRGLDAKDSGRPEEPMSEEDMTVLLDCRICYSQKAEICTLPCGHLTMCRWCSDQHSPTLAHDRTWPRRAANCPVCRKGIRQKVRVIRA